MNQQAMKRRDFLKGTLAAIAAGAAACVAPVAATQPVVDFGERRKIPLYIIDVQYDFRTPDGGVLHVGKGYEAKHFAKSGRMVADPWNDHPKRSIFA